MRTPVMKILTRRFCVSSMTFGLVLVVSAAVFGSGCGVRDNSGKCKDYEPLQFFECPEGTKYLCDTTEDGCRQCGCVAPETLPPNYTEDREY